MIIIPVYNKAVRDKIPEIIQKSGSECNIKVLSDPEFLPLLEKKLHEELEEYESSKSVEELTDLIEIIYRIAELRGTPNEALDKMRFAKREKRGGFDKNLYLIDTTSARKENSKEGVEA